MTKPNRASKRVTISDIAARSGVSIGAVSFALNGRKGVSEATRARVLKVADDLGWAPASAARSLAASRTNTVGLVLARDPQSLGPESFYLRFLAGIEAELSRHNYGLLMQVVASPADEIATLRSWSKARRVDGVLLVDLAQQDPRVEFLAEAGAPPAVVVGDPAVAGPLSSVWTDDAAAVRACVAYLAGLGHRRIARVAGLERFAHTQIRDHAFWEEMTARGLEPILIRADYSADSAGEGTREMLLAPDPPTGIVYDNDIMAMAGISIAMELGVAVPDEVSIVAWDDSTLCELTFPKLTAVGHDIVARGSHAARRLLEVVEGATAEAQLSAVPTLTVRASTGSPPPA